MAKKSMCKTGGMTNPNKAKVSPKPKGIGPSSPVKYKGGGPTSYKAKPAVVAKVAKVNTMKKGGSTKKKMDRGGSVGKKLTSYPISGKAENKLREVKSTQVSKKTTPVSKTTVSKKSTTKPLSDDEFNRKMGTMTQSEWNEKTKKGVRIVDTANPENVGKREETLRGDNAPISTTKMTTVKVTDNNLIPTKTIPTVSTKSNPVAVKRKKKKMNMGGNSSKKAGILSGMDYGMPEENSGILSMKKGGMPKKAKGGSAHPGFKAVQNKIASKQGISKQAAGAILASSTRNASKAAKRKNPRLNRVKG